MLCCMCCLGLHVLANPLQGRLPASLPCLESHMPSVRLSRDVELVLAILQTEEEPGRGGSGPACLLRPLRGFEAGLAGRPLAGGSGAAAAPGTSLHRQQHPPPPPRRTGHSLSPPGGIGQTIAAGTRERRAPCARPLRLGGGAGRDGQLMHRLCKKNVCKAAAAATNWPASDIAGASPQGALARAARAPTHARVAAGVGP